MKIGYDGKRAANNLTGLGNYSRSLIEHLATLYPKNQYLIYTPKIKQQIKNYTLFNLPNVDLKFPLSKNLIFLWRSFGIKKQILKDKIDLFHGLSHEIPIGLKNTGIKTIVTIHDLIFLRYPQNYTLIDRTLYKLKSRYACKNADRIIAISEQTKKDIVEFYGINPDKIEVIYQSSDDGFKTLLSEEQKNRVRIKYRLPNKYILSLGTIEPRKNLLLIINALPQIDPSYLLVVIGKETPYFKKVMQRIDELNLHNRVAFVKDIPFIDLPSIYQMATTFIYPSIYEGFGIPIAEALYSNTPVIAATGSCLEEAGGPDSIYVAPTNSDELAKAVNKVLIDENLQLHMKNKGMNYVQRFNNIHVTEQLIDCYKKTLA